ncbi:MAG: D-alanyl-D-alanine carboxypeptidase/D-alanyl-D-alanine endopeptidase, partial [Acidimicrobiales bacterium]
SGDIPINDVIVDPSYFSSTRSGPGWPPRYIPVDVGPMSGFMVDNNQHRGDSAYLANPDLGNAQLVASVLEASGFDVQGVPRVGSPPPSAIVVGERRSPTLAAMVDLILRRSDNEVAEALVRQIGLSEAGESEIDVGKAVIYERVSQLGLDLGEPVGDGSGLSRQNRLSARQLVGALRLGQAQPWWDVVDNGLADAGARGTLEERLQSDNEIGEIRAKTGTLADVSALSGVITTVDGVEVTFSFLINGQLDEDSVEIMDQIVVAFATATSDQLVSDLSERPS